MNRNFAKLRRSQAEFPPKAQKPFHIEKKPSASSLITTLLVLVVLSTIVVAFMQSMSVERNVARSAKNTFQARLAADAGAEAAKSQLLTLFSRYSDSATVWQSLPSGLPNEGTVYYFRAQPLASPSALSLPSTTNSAAFNPTPGTVANVQIYAWPLISGGTPVIASNLANAFTNSLTVTNSIDLNANNWIGTAPGQSRKALRAQWVYLTNREGATNARYAYWVEDESFKVNVSLATNVVRGTTSLGSNTTEIPLQGLLEKFSGNIGNIDSAAAQIVALRTNSGISYLPSFNCVSQPFNLIGTNSLSEQLKFVATAYSSSLNFSRGGWKRVNINGIFTDGSPARDQLDRFITTITNASASPLFPQRFYRQSLTAPALNLTNTVTPTNAPLYVQKLAANAKDYIDADSQPTIVFNTPGFPVAPVAAPTNAIEPAGTGNTGPNPVAAIGKENVPMLQEYAIDVRLLQMTPAGWSSHNPGPPGAAFRFSVDHYFEFWNMGTKDIYATTNAIPAGAVNLGGDAFLEIYNQPSYGSDDPAKNPTSDIISPPIHEGRPIRIPLNGIPNLRFEAGKVTVLTTDLTPNIKLLSPGATVFKATIASTDRIFSGNTTDSASGSANKVTDASGTVIFNNSYRVVLDARSNANNDYESCVYIGNGQGLVESFCALPIVSSSGKAISINLQTPDRLVGNPGFDDTYFVRGGSLRGNSGTPFATSGDPRSLNEQMQLIPFDTTDSLNTDQTRFYTSNLENASVPASSSMGTLNTNYVDPTKWPDYSVNSTGATDAPSFIADAPLVSIGELGHFYDPSRVQGYTNSNNPYAGIGLSRGGGRTLHIGQPEQWSSTTNPSGLWDGLADSASRTWAAWRLADFFHTTTNTILPGVININGVRKDNGLAFRAILMGFTYQDSPNGGPSLAGITPTTAQLDSLVAAMTNRLNGADASLPGDDLIFWERGELSELALFQTNTALVGVNMGQALDRGREELVRRNLNLVTTKGNTYTAYVVGQALSVDSSGKIKVISTSQMKQTFQILSDDLAAQVDTFNPSSATDVTARFSPATNFYTKPLWNFRE